MFSIRTDRDKLILVANSFGVPVDLRLIKSFIFFSLNMYFIKLMVIGMKFQNEHLNLPILIDF